MKKLRAKYNNIQICPLTMAAHWGKCADVQHFVRGTILHNVSFFSRLRFACAIARYATLRRNVEN